MTLFFDCNLGSGIHVQIMQDCWLGTYMARWFAAFIPPITYIWYFSLHYPSPPSPPSPPLVPLHRPQFVMLPSLCPCVLIIQHSHLSENMWCLIFCSCVGLLRMMVSRFIHVPTKDMKSSFWWLHNIPWCMPHFPCPVSHWWALGLVPCLCYCK